MASKIMDDRPVDRCECLGKNFADLRQYTSLEEAIEETEVGTQCSGCRPYLKLVFSTGETSFQVEDPRLEDELPKL
ncbi:MAG: hypothetical protein Q9M28_07505 [Mariprofundaceae bacterium]|nr:hypothetical protein [Mariprofundaceae bacterium]